MAKFSSVEADHHEKLQHFKDIDALVADRTLCCGRSVQYVKPKFGWAWSLKVFFRDQGALCEQSQLLGMEKTADGKNNPNGYLNSIFRDQRLEWPIHSIRFERVGKKTIIKQYEDEGCPCLGMTDEQLSTWVAGDDPTAAAGMPPEETEEIPF